eukprot:10279040-Alexandrium_andersonii.AAC.1
MGDAGGVRRAVASHLRVARGGLHAQRAQCVGKGVATAAHPHQLQGEAGGAFAGVGSTDWGRRSSH